MGRTGTHVIVVGNEKGGSGKSTTAFRLAIYLLYQGFRVASIDVDSRQQTFTNYVKNRRSWAQARDLQLPHPTHFHLPLTKSDSIKENQKLEFDLFRQAPDTSKPEPVTQPMTVVPAPSATPAPSAPAAAAPAAPAADDTTGERTLTRRELRAMLQAQAANQQANHSPAIADPVFPVTFTPDADAAPVESAPAASASSNPAAAILPAA